MKAAILVKQKKPLVIADIDLPNKLEYGQVKVKVVYSGICGSQIGEIDGVKGEDPFLPHLLGHEAGAVVEEIGPGVCHVQPGDHVVLHWLPGKGIQSATPCYQWQGRQVNAGWVTTFNEYAIVSENRMTKIDDTIDLQVAALYGCAITTGFGSVINDACLRLGESIAIFGVGGVGLSAILAAKLSSANPIIAIDNQDHKLEKAKSFGATHLINNADENPESVIKQLLPQGVDVCIDNTGVDYVREQAYRLCSTTGRTVLVGVPKHVGEEMCINSLQLHFGKKLIGSHGGGVNPTYHIPRFIALQEQGLFDPKQMISHCFKLDDINQAIAALRHGEVTRCSIDMGH